MITGARSEPTMPPATFSACGSSRSTLVISPGRPVRMDASVPEDAWRLGEVKILRRIRQDDGPAVELLHDS
jgi:hypothetical protein